ncbi:MAG: glutamate-5-semialdehyde dehydrogenase [Methanobacteriota archaeon]
MTSAVRAKAEAARAASLVLSRATDDARKGALGSMSRALADARPAILRANGDDLDEAKQEVSAGRLAEPLLARLSIQGDKLSTAIEGVHAVAALPDPLGRTLRSTLLDDGLRLYEVTVPLGVVACAFESRPDAVVQISALGVRSGNAVLLKGGREASRTNAALVDAIRAGLASAGLPVDAVQLLAGREELQALLSADDLVDLVVPRGSAAFVRHVQSSTRIPVMGHAEGVCHTYIDRAADPAKAIRIAVDAKTDYPAACNTTECFLVHSDVAASLIPSLVRALSALGVEVRADETAIRYAPGAVAAAEADFGKEFGDLTCAVRVVDSVEDAVGFVNRHGSRHTDAIVTEDRDAARRFVEGVDAAGVYVNASTRFADGYRYGLGAEVGVSTSKLHARGPVGLEGLTSTKWILLGDGHVAADYQGPGAKRFLHRPLGEDWHGP